MTITSVTKDTDAISYVEDGVTKKLSITGSDIVISFPPASMDRIVNMYRQQSDGHVIISYFDTSSVLQTIDIDPSAGGGDLLADGTVPLTANWDVGAYVITALRFISDQATGTAPFTVASTTKVTNLNADQVDGVEAAALLLIANLENPPTEDEANKAPTSEWAFDHDAADTGIHGAGTDTIATDADIATHAAIKAANATLGHVIVETGSAIDVDGDGKLTLGAHKDTHDPDGSDPLDAAAPDTNITPEAANAEGDASTWARSDHMHYIPSGAPSELADVQAAAEGSGAAFARTDHAHQIQHDITDNHLVTIDGSPNDAEVTVWTASGLDGKTYAEFHALQFAANLPEDVAIKIDAALSADGKYCAILAVTGTAGADLTYGEAVYFAVADSKWEKAKGDAEATVSPMTGIVIVAGLEDAAVTICIIGEVRADTAFPALTIGAPVFIDPDTAGDVSSTELTTGEFQKALGWATTANSILLTGNADWVKVG